MEFLFILLEMLAWWLAFTILFLCMYYWQSLLKTYWVMSINGSIFYEEPGTANKLIMNDSAFKKIGTVRMTENKFNKLAEFRGL